MERTKADKRSGRKSRFYEEYSRFDRNRRKNDQVKEKAGFAQRTAVQFMVCLVIFLLAVLLRGSDTSFALQLKENLSKSISATTSAQDVAVFFNAAKDKYTDIKNMAVSAFSKNVKDDRNTKSDGTNKDATTSQPSQSQQTTQDKTAKSATGTAPSASSPTTQGKTDSTAKFEKTAAQMLVATNPDYINTVSFDSFTTLFSTNTAKKEVVSITPKIVNAVSYQETDGDDKSEVYDFDTGEKRIDLPTNVNNDNLILPFEMNPPLSGTITSDFGGRINPVTKKKSFHYGVDIGGYTGEYIVAPADGVIEKISSGNAYGNSFIINHSKGIKTFYGHCSKILVKVGQSVKAGQKIAQVGSTGWSTGPHLHFEIYKDSMILNPLNFFDFS